MLDTRMLFSTLVDADFLATEGHFNGDAKVPYRPRAGGLPLDAAAMRTRLLEHLESMRKDGSCSMDDLRRRLMQDCAAAGASSSTGQFTLTAPTGTGKTLAMLRFCGRARAGPPDAPDRSGDAIFDHHRADRPNLPRTLSRGAFW